MVTFVYSLSSVDRLVSQAVMSIRTLTKTVSPEQVVVFFTPPRLEEDVARLRDLGVDVRLTDNRTDGFSLVPGSSGSRYGEKMELTTVDDETVVFLDCDTVVAGDILELVTGSDKDLGARWVKPDNQQEWQEATDGVVDRYPNTGFLVFRNGSHRLLHDPWRRWYKRGLPYHAENHTTEQYALALAAADVGLSTEHYGPGIHSMEWEETFTPDAVVYHYATYSESLVDRVPPTLFGLLPEPVKRLVRRLQQAF